MKRAFGFAAAFLLAIVMCCGFAACKNKDNEIQDEQEEERIAYEGTYKLQSLVYGGLTMNVGDSGLLGRLTDDIAVVTLKADGTMSFHCDILLIKFDITGTWVADENDKTALTVTVEGTDTTEQAEISATCDGKTIVIDYQAVFTLKKA